MTDVGAFAGRVRARLVQNGWTQRTYGARRGPNCLLGAIELQADAEKIDGQPYYQLLAELRALFATETGSPSFTAWNDDPTRALPEVLAVLAAIESA